MRKISDSTKSEKQVNYKLKEIEIIEPSETVMPLESVKNNDEENDLKFFQKFFFGLAGLPFQAYFCAIGVFTTVYLLNKAGLPPEKTTYL